MGSGAVELGAEGLRRSTVAASLRNCSHVCGPSHKHRVTLLEVGTPLTVGLPQPAPATCRLKAPEYLSKQDRVHGMYYPSPSGHRRMNVPPDGHGDGLKNTTF